MSAQTTAQPAQPMFINIPQPPSNPDTPSEMPGTPTSTTTSLSALSTTAIKDGQRGGHVPSLINGNTPGSNASGSGGTGGHHRGHHHHNSTNSLEAERADRISRLTGLSGVSTLRPSYTAGRGSVGSGARLAVNGSGAGGAGTPGSASGAGTHGMFSTTPTSSHNGGFGVLVVPGPLTPAFFDAQGQPVAITKMSTVGTASATDSLSGRTLGDEDDTDTGDRDTLPDDDDMLSMDTNYRAGTDRGADYDDDDDHMMMDDDNLDAASRSAGGYEDRMSDDGSASLVGFGEGAGSTVSGPIYHRRPLPPTSLSSAGAMGAMALTGIGGSLERTNSGLSDAAVVGSVNGSISGNVPVGGSARRDFVRSPLDFLRDSGSGAGSSGAPSVGGGPVGGGLAYMDSPGSNMAVDGGSYITGTATSVSTDEDDVFVDHSHHHQHYHNVNGSAPRSGGGGTAAGTSSSAALSMAPLLGGNIIQAHPSALRETQRPRSHQQLQQQAQFQSTVNGNGTAGASPVAAHTREREAAEQIMRSFEGHGHNTRSGAGGITGGVTDGIGGASLGSPSKTGGGRLGRFYFEERK